MSPLRNEVCHSFQGANEKSIFQNEEIVTLDQVDNLNSIEDFINGDNSEEDEEETTSYVEKSMSCSTSSSSFRLDLSNS